MPAKLLSKHLFHPFLSEELESNEVSRSRYKDTSIFSWNGKTGPAWKSLAGFEIPTLFMYYRYFLKQGALFDTRSKEIEQLIVRIDSVFNAYFTKFSTLVMKQEDNQVRNYVFILKLKEQNKRTTNGR